MRVLAILLSALLWLPMTAAMAQNGPLRIEITEGVVEPLTFAIPTFEAEDQGAAQLAGQLSRVVAADLSGTGLFREIPSTSFIAQRASFAAPVRFPDWRAINAQAMITGAVSTAGGRLTVKFRIYDIFSGSELGQGQQLVGTEAGWRRMAHKIADQVYSRITGEAPYFDSRVVFVSETGPKSDRKRRIAIMDYDGANTQFLTDSNAIVLAPRFSPTGDRILYTSYETGFPQIYVLDVASVRRRSLETGDGSMSFAPRFAPDGQTAVYSLERGGNSDLYTVNLNTGARTRLTNAPSIETAPSYSPDGRQIVFESDRSGTQQLYVMPAGGGEARRISFGDGRYSTPVWSPRGDLIAFTKQTKGRFAIGVMRVDGSEERLLSASPLDEGPTWSPNGRVIMFTRETLGENGAPAIYSVDITGRNLQRVDLPTAASDPAWGPLQP
ncbi:Tol-Pal system beta propeller repeat protein TolB [Shimia ponticola]|uniref:Tol-Pal system beta propeller repeat protein TolB n=1 Tax=Shimia ponticola TaxID=2582893 RepID=UPI0011BDED33|nr:Tol-Pal system beta propeller repeat protein TolB [Shimia ponticola]